AAGAGLLLALPLLLTALFWRHGPRGSSPSGGLQSGNSSTAQNAPGGGNPASARHDEAAEADSAASTPTETAAPGPKPASGTTEVPAAGDGSGQPQEPEPPTSPSIALVRPIGEKPAGKSGAGSGKEGEFFNLKARGTRFVYVVDCSGSMTGQPLQRACQELLDSVNRLEPNQSFFVVFFADGPYPQFHPDTGSRLIPSTPKNRRRLREWVAGIGPMGGTEPLQSLLLALSLKPDAIYFLTDGQFSPLVADEVRLQNSARIPIHTVAFLDPAGERLLEQIAQESGGAHRFVPR
ncbi:MAG: VWA domain-containing protein, partial [Planctomycetes bacterium]|nr:VWA domain-containing protein [Planctomycetota bacterium]